MMDFDVSQFARSLDALTMAAEDNLARALREMSTCDRVIVNEGEAQLKMLEVRAAVERTTQMRTELLELLSSHRPRQIALRATPQALDEPPLQIPTGIRPARELRKVSA